MSESQKGKAEITKEARSGVIDMRVSGRVDIYNAKELESELQSNLKAGAKFTCLDFGELESIDSSGLAVLMRQLQIFVSEGGEIVIYNVNDRLQSLLTITKFDSFFRIYDGKQEAIDHFSKKKKGKIQFKESST